MRATASASGIGVCEDEPVIATNRNRMRNPHGIYAHLMLALSALWFLARIAVLLAVQIGVMTIALLFVGGFWGMAMIVGGLVLITWLAELMFGEGTPDPMHLHPHDKNGDFMIDPTIRIPRDNHGNPSW